MFQCIAPAGLVGGDCAKLHKQMIKKIIMPLKGVKKLAIVITDGRSTAAGDLLIIAKTIHKVHRDITVIAVGTGKGADQRELNLIASGTDDDNVYNVISFPRLAEIKDEMIGRICEGT